MCFPVQFVADVIKLLSEEATDTKQDAKPASSLGQHLGQRVWNTLLRWLRKFARPSILRRCLYAFLLAFPALTLLSFTLASFNYYILYHIMPNFITRLLFHCYMCAPCPSSPGSIYI